MTRTIKIPDRIVKITVITGFGSFDIMIPKHRQKIYLDIFTTHKDIKYEID